ncbi:gamma interferon inducible lysosomal thiol reductase (GILT) protein [Toxoplasma gondii GT1]|uniref:Gamma interferon inducible lysosomal thiol reductase (GILT) protein n=3 Tax=Toxoplasma gondii TaxID=5811 RepID=S7UPV3_TOXGG|nr:gamma interferon inducible lysosomal thiol reductase (GILT) protein [Toxoplasma gondii GT1]KAF4644567.1 gamma interferon inducible lysosomal thiol reductase (GILT) protein [Toxoplasma gondii]
MADIRTCAEAFFAFFLAVSLPFCGSASGATAQNSVKVDILYESKCPFCFSWLKEELHAAVEHLGDDVLRKANIVFDPLPFGNAKEIPDGKGGFSFECQHGQSECYLNKVEACGLSIIGREQVKAWSEWLLCVEAASAFPPELRVSAPPVSSPLLGQHLLLLSRFSRQLRSTSAVPAPSAAAWVSSLSPAQREEIADTLRVSRQLARDTDAGTVNGDPSAGENEAEAEGQADERTEEGAKGDHELAERLKDSQYNWLLCPVPTDNMFRDILAILACAETAEGDKLVHAVAARTGAHDYVPWVRVNGEHSEAAENSLRCALCRAVDLSHVPEKMQEWCKQEDACMQRSSNGRCFRADSVTLSLASEETRDARLRVRRQREA